MSAAARSIPSLSKISREIGVSPATISRVLNGNDNVSEKLRKDVLQALEQRGYSNKPVRGASQALRNKSNTLAFAISAQIKESILQGDIFYSRHLLAFQTACAQFGCYPLLIDHEQDATANGGLRCVDDGKVYGIVGEHIPDSRLEVLQRQVPVVLLNAQTSTAGVDCIIPDVRQGAREQLDLLYQLGHRSVACFRLFPGGWQDQQFWFEFQFHGIKLGLEQPTEFFGPLFFTCRDEELAAKTFLDKVLACPRPPTAIVTQDRYAVTLISLCQQCGLEVPRDMSIFGFDDRPMNSPIPLASYRQNFDAMAREAVRSINDRVNNPDLPCRTIMIEGSTIQRESVAEVQPARKL